MSRPAGCRRHPEALVGPSAGRWLRQSTWALTTTWGILRSRLPGSDHATGHSESPALLRACLACCLSSCLSGKGHLSEEISSTAVYSLNTYFVAGPVQGWREDAGPPGSPRTRAHTHTPILQPLPSQLEGPPRQAGPQVPLLPSFRARPEPPCSPPPADPAASAPLQALGHFHL